VEELDGSAKKDVADEELCEAVASYENVKILR
jgi:hypothetical protein